MQDPKSLGHPAFLGQRQGGEWEVEDLGHDPEPIEDPSTCKARI